jgi:alpha-mannosidase
LDKKSAEFCQKRLRRLMDRMAARFTPQTISFQAECSRTEQPVSFEQRLGLEYRPIGEGECWGQAWDSAWFRLQAVVPAAWAGETIVARLEFGGEALVFLPDGRMLQSVTNGSVFKANFVMDIAPLLECCRGGEPVELWVEAAANSLFGVFQDADPAADSPARYGRFEAEAKSMRLCTFDPELWQLWLDLRVIEGLVRQLPEGSVRRARLLRCLNRAMDAYDGSSGGASGAASEFRSVLATELSRPAVPSALTAVAVGHAHIDTAWLWPVREGIRKCARTFSTQISLLRKYPQYVFGASQPQHYAFVKERYPGLYREIKEAVAQGRWEPQGGMWVEADCNLISGESIIRQILHGKNFFRDEFGFEVDNLWLPDVFGYSAALPQILRRSGIRSFLTQKLSWNQINEFPHHSFRWRGIDGSEVTAHFPPANSYCDMLESDALIRQEENFKEKEILDEFLVLFGVGDGGGGPREENIELGLRQQNLEGVPRVRFGSAREFFQRLESRRAELSVWDGELYLEGHRGTLTSQARVKRANRQLELRLREVEMLSSLLPPGAYPGVELDRIWKTVLLNQFHDIIPGSSIHETYEVTHREHQEALAQCRGLLQGAAARLLQPAPGCLVVINTLASIWNAPVRLPAEWAGCEVLDESDRPRAVQPENGAQLVHVRLEPYSFVTLFRGGPTAAKADTDDLLVLENDLVRYEFDSTGVLTAARDKEAGRNLLVPGQCGNVLTLYEDRPNDWDAWDIDLTYEGQVRETVRGQRVEPRRTGLVCQTLRFAYAVGRSIIEQRVILGQASKRLDFVTEVDWRERHKMLRVHFPVDLRSDHATFDIQYGYVRRPTHRNTSWDAARFEVAGHRYADLSQPDYGVALLNNCKYGYKVHGQSLDLNLLRSPTYPDPDCDQGRHEFTYSLLPHLGDLPRANVMAEAACLNQGLLLFDGFRTDLRRWPWRVEGDGLSLEVVKRAEKEDCLVLRLVESDGRCSRGRLFCEPAGGTLIETDLMEREEGQTIVLDRPIEIALQPFEIRTYKLKEMK